MAQASGLNAANLVVKETLTTTRAIEEVVGWENIWKGVWKEESDRGESVGGQREPSNLAQRLEPSGGVVHGRYRRHRGRRSGPGVRRELSACAVASSSAFLLNVKGSLQLVSKRAVLLANQARTNDSLLLQYYDVACY